MSADDPEGPRRSRPVSRRGLLAALAVGGGGIAATAAAGSTFSNVEGTDASLAAGAVDVRVDWTIVDGIDEGEAGRSDGRVEIPIAYDEDERSGAALLEIGHESVDGNNPVDLWLRGNCPESLGTLGELAEFELSYADCETGDSGAVVTTGTVREVFDDLSEGIPVDGVPSTDGRDCLDPSTPACLRLEWNFGGYVGGESATASIEAVGRQCRHANRSTPPFDPAPKCPPADPCPCCLDLGKLELEDDGPPGIGENRIAPGTYPFTEGAAGYYLRVTDTVEKDGGETVAVAFSLIDESGDRGPPLCRVDVAGGPGVGPGPGGETYEPPADGPYGNATTTLTDDGDGLLFARRRAGSGDDPDDYHGISHVTVAVCAAEGRCE